MAFKQKLRYCGYVKVSNTTQNNFDRGLSAEKKALAVLQTKFKIEDRSGWATDRNKDKNAMDWYFSDLNIAVDFKSKHVYKKYNTVTVDADDLYKYLTYIKEHKIQKGYIWFQDPSTLEEYRVDIEMIHVWYDQNKIARRFSKKSMPWESGYFYTIPVELCDKITEEDYSIKKLSKND
jgi:hypothetical protein